jgi:hypothetical protein
MLNMTRRTLLRNSGIAASAATLLHPVLAEAGIAEAAEAPAAAGKVFHIFAFQWKPEATDALKEKATMDIAAFQGKIPGLLETHVGPNLSPRGKGYTFGGVMRFKDQASLDAYVQHPMHQALLKWLVPLIDAIELDLRA